MFSERFNPPRRRLFKENEGLREPPIHFANSAGPDFDPVLHANSAKAHGQIGNTAWAIFERGDGLVLSFQPLGRSQVVIPVDSVSEKGGFLRFITALLRVAPRLP